jgi:hypothetical protein
MSRRGTEPFVYRDPLYLSGAILLFCFVGAIYVVYSGRHNYDLLLALHRLKPGDVESFAGPFLAERPFYPFAMATISFCQGVVSLAWLYVVSGNTMAFGARGQRYGLDWAVGCYFVPLANLVWPYLSMNEILRASRLPSGWHRLPDSNLVAAWWASFILSPLMWLLVPHLVPPLPVLAANVTAADLMRWNVVLWVLLPFDFLRFAFAFWLTATIQFAQERQAVRIIPTAAPATA